MAQHMHLPDPPLLEFEPLLCQNIWSRSDPWALQSEGRGRDLREGGASDIGWPYGIWGDLAHMVSESRRLKQEGHRAQGKTITSV